MYIDIENAFGIDAVRALEYLLARSIDRQRAAYAFHALPRTGDHRPDIAHAEDREREFSGDRLVDLPPLPTIGLFGIIVVTGYRSCAWRQDDIGAHIAQGARQHAIFGKPIRADHQTERTVLCRGDIESITLGIKGMAYIEFV